MEPRLLTSPRQVFSAVGFPPNQKFCFSGYIIQDDLLDYCFYKYMWKVENLENIVEVDY